MNITDIIDRLAEDVYDGKDLEEVIDTFINTATYETHTHILDEIGDVDLSDPRPDLSKGWPEVRAQLAYNALRGAVASAAAELRHEAQNTKSTEPCPRCGSTSHACETGTCLHCDSEECLHLWFPGQPDTGPESYRRYLRSGL
jgi:NADH pyrophosphatase NudC (nudix superfamily)